MPELPEVEVLRRSLEPHLPGLAVEGVELRCAALRERIDTESLERAVGRTVRALRRRAKYLLIDLEGDLVLVIHLGMSGRLTLKPIECPPEPHEHVDLLLEGGRRLVFKDPRRFGLVLLLASSEVDSDRRFAHLGQEPLAEDFSGASLRRAAAGRRAPVKSFLMDSRVVVGLGNIYACEALFRAGIHPRRSVARIALRRWELLAVAARETLQDAIDQGGTTLNDFSDGLGEPGYFQVDLAVYGRAGEPCLRCGRDIRRAVQSGRSTFYCPACQR